ncbi:MAG TPA: Gfo/Idh/MocA family oxidoreductase, partial [Chloroflexota bacterium]|nr:Gfo/Idh/MocA family oxidoreductase [Chloroflexota bacterium]
YGTGHGHASGKAWSMIQSPDVDFAGIYEPVVVEREAGRNNPAYSGVRWFESAAELLDDTSITAIAVEGRNDQSLAMAAEAVAAGKHLWYDKPAGDNWESYQRLVADARERSLQIQMGYMFRYHTGFRQVSDWARSGFLGDIFSVRAHMSTWLSFGARQVVSQHRGGIFYDLGGHMLDQVVWILGRPNKVTAILRNDATPGLPAYRDNTIGVFEFDRAIAFIDIASMEVRPMARRFEVYGTRGSAIMEPFEPDLKLALCLDEAQGGYHKGWQDVPIEPQPRQTQYDRELVALVAVLRGEKTPDRPVEHDLIVQETLLRAAQGI